MMVDPKVPGIQVIIVANTRELIRQVQQVLAELTKDMAVTSIIGDTETPEQPTQHILVTVPAWIAKRASGRKKINLKNLKMIVYDEADEIYLQESNHQSIKTLNKHVSEELKLNPQQVLFSATYPENVMHHIKGFISKFREFKIKNEALKLKGVKQFKMEIEPGAKLEFIKEIYLTFEKSQTMIFTNTKKDAQ